MRTIKQAKDIPLVPLPELKKSLKQIFSNTKKGSDTQLAALQASNAKHRNAKKRQA